MADENESRRGYLTGRGIITVSGVLIPEPAEAFSRLAEYGIEPLAPLEAGKIAMERALDRNTLDHAWAFGFLCGHAIAWEQATNADGTGRPLGGDGR